MSKAASDKIRSGLEDALAYAEQSADADAYRIHIPESVDVKALRQRLGLSQSAFAMRYGFSVGRIRDWEQGRSSIDAPSRVLLTVIDKEPDAVNRALGAV